MLFRKKPKPPLDEAAALVDRAVAITRAYWRDTLYRPSESDLAAFRTLERRLLASYGAVRRIVIRMERRFCGEPEVRSAKQR